jgi:hypothetical protein
MKYALGNMLNGARGLNADGLSLDLQFAADKTLTARKGPTPTFTRASTATFVGSDGLIQSAAINAARFDHDPITLACKGLLIEESRTNSITGSNAFNTWTLGNATVAASSVVTPEGTADAWKVVEDSLLSIHAVTSSFTSVSGTTYTASVWLKAAENGFAFVGLVGSGFATFTLISVNLSTGAVTTATGVPVGATSVAHSNGWWRVSVSQVATSSASSNIDIRLSRDGVFTNRSYLGNGVNGMYCYGAQVEAGAFPTSYIPTVAASVVRSADVCSITGSDFTGFWNRFAGTCVVGVGSSLGSVPRFVSNAGSARTLEIYGTTNIDFFEAAGAQEIRVVTSPTYPIKLGLAYAINDYQSSYNGLLGGSDTNTGGTIPNATALHIGNLGGTSNRLTGHIQSIRYFKKRLANAKLASFTV